MEDVYLHQDDDGWGSSAMPPEQPRGSFSGQADAEVEAESPALVLNLTALRTTISEPLKHGEGTGAFVNYLISTKTTLQQYANSDVVVRRRYQDFHWLHNALADELPSCILPPLPGKHRMEYLTGDRFSSEFIEKRRVSLQSYIDRLTRHPKVQRSKVLQRFLESSELIPDAVSKGKESHVLENISDVFINAFSKVRKPDERFTEFKDQLQKFEDNITTVEKLQAKMVKIQTELELDLLEFGNVFTTLGTMETQITGPLTDFSNIVRNVCSILHDKVYSEDVVYLNSIREYIGYCKSVKEVLRSRDQKQIDFEELSTYLHNHIADRDRTMNPQRNGGGLASFFSNKMQELKGVDQEKSRQQKLIKLAAKINELQEAVEISNEVAIAFSADLVKEIEFFQSVKIIDWKKNTKDYAQSQIDYYEKSLKHWDQIIPVLEDIALDPPVENQVEA